MSIGGYKMNSNDLKNWLKKWEGELKKEKLQLQERLKYIDDTLLKLHSGLSGEHEFNVAKPVISKTKRINKKKAILQACKNINKDFSANDVKEILEQSENEEIRNIQIGYISAQLCRLAEEGIIYIVRKGAGKGNPNIYSNISGEKENTENY